MSPKRTIKHLKWKLGDPISEPEICRFFESDEFGYYQLWRDWILPGKKWKMIACEKCGGDGWCWGYELHNADEDTLNDDQTFYTCDACDAYGFHPGNDND